MRPDQSPTTRRRAIHIERAAGRLSQYQPAGSICRSASSADRPVLAAGVVDDLAGDEAGSRGDLGGLGVSLASLLALVFLSNIHALSSWSPWALGASVADLRGT